MQPQLDAFTKAYLECALRSSTDDDDQPLDENYTIADLAPETIQQAIADCCEFQVWFGDLFNSAAYLAGRDFWLTRNGHGAGFWDGGWKFSFQLRPYHPMIEYTGKAEIADVGRFLTEMSKSYGEVDLYVRDDGLIHS